MDEQWGWVKKKQSRVTEADDPSVGDAWTWVALDGTSRLIISFFVGKRGEETGRAFMDDVRCRLVVMPQITSDGYVVYPKAVGESFGWGVDYGQTVKNYRTGSKRGPDHRYEPPREPFVEKRSVFGAPNMKKATTSHVERNNLTIRHIAGRMRRLCLAFSKKIENHKAAISLAYTWYNFGLIVKTLRVTPAMAAGITDHVWSLEEFMDTVLSEKPNKKPTMRPLGFRVPEVTARELPDGRGFLRVVQGDGTGQAQGPVSPSPTPAVPAVAAQAEVATAPLADEQLDLLSWKRKPTNEE